MAARSADWLLQAQRDLEHARRDAVDGYYEWGSHITIGGCGADARPLLHTDPLSEWI